MNIEIVTHCWQYWRCLSLQLSSFLLEPPSSVRVTISVCYSPEDLKTVKRLADIMGWMEINGHPETVDLRGVPFDRELLCRRAIGRNVLALETEADWVWFADCDMTFRGSSMDALGRELAVLGKERPDVKMVYPKFVQVPTQESGDKIIYGVDEKWDGPVEVDAKGFSRKRYHAAIGGAQVVRADVCHSEGYLNKFPRLRRPEKRWKRTREDPHFRKKCIGGNGHPISTPEVCGGIARIRHTQRGRFDIGLEM